MNGAPVRLFVSSTFADLRAEREALHADVFPRLRQYCADRGVPFAAVDLRWGISREAGLDNTTVEICLEEVARCRSSPGFVLLLGDRYGWRPLPPRVPAGEMAALGRLLDDGERELVARWYRRDDNAVPREYVLRPREGAFTADAVWLAEEARLRGVLVPAAVRAGLPADALRRYTASITEHEAAAGLRPDVHVFLRTIDGVPEGVYRDDAADELARFRQSLRAAAAPGHLHEYKSRWTGDGPSLDHVPALCADLYAALTRTIDEELARQQATGALAERARHARFGAERSRDFVGRDDELAAVAHHVAGHGDRPVLVLGPSGVGKTAFMARAAELAARDHPEGSLIVRFAGATGRASGLEPLLRDLLAELRGPGPDRLADLIEAYRAEMDAPRDGLVLIFVDALDQLGPGPLDLSWLGPRLPAAVRVVVSCADGPLAARLERQLAGGPVVRLDPLPEADSGALLDAWLAGAGRRLQPRQRAAVLAAASATGLPLHLRLAFAEARRWPSYAPAGETRMPDTVAAVLGRLFARLSREADHGAVLVSRALGYLAASRSGLAEEELLDVLSADQVVRADLRRRSPHSPEVDRVPDAVWARLHSDLGPYLTERDSGGRTLLGFYHRQLAEAAEREFLDGPGRHARLAAYFGGRTDPRALDELPYQQACAGEWEAVHATLTDLTFLAAKSRLLGVDAVVDDLHFAAGRAPAGHPLIAAFRDVERILDREGHLFAAGSAVAGGAVAGAGAGAGGGRELVAQQVLFAAEELGMPAPAEVARQQLAGLGATHLALRWWRGGASGQALLRTVDGHPGTVRHLAALPDGSGAVTVSSWAELFDDGSSAEHLDPPRLWDLRTWTAVQSFDEIAPDHPDRVAVTPDGRFAVFHSGRARQFLVWDLANRRLAGRHDVPRATRRIEVVDTPDGGRYAVLAPAYSHGGLTLWPVTGESVPAALVAAADAVRVLAVGAAGKVAVAARYLAPDATPLEVWDLASGTVTHQLAGSTSAGHVAVDPEGRRAVGLTAEGAGVWDVAGGALERVVELRTSEIRGCVVTADGEYGVFANWYRHRLVVVRLADGRCHEIDGLDASPDEVVRHAAPAQVLTARGGGFRQWNVAPTRAGAGPGNLSRVVHAAVLPDGRRAVTVSYRDLVVWDLDTGAVLLRREPDGQVGGFALAPDGRHAALHCRGSVELWDLDEGTESGRVPAGTSSSSPVAFLPDGRLLLRQGDRGLRIVDPATGADDHALPPVPGFPEAARHLLATPDGRTALIAVGWHVYQLDLERRDYVEHWAAPSIGYQRYGQSQPLEAVALAPDGGRLFVAMGHGVDVWELGSKRPVHRFDHAAEVAAVAVSADGSLVVAGGGSAVSVWDPHTRHRLARLELPGEVTAVATAIDGAAVLAGGVGGAVHCLRLAGLSTGNRIPHTFRVLRRTAPGEDVYVVGEAPELGGWDPDRAVRLTWTPGHIWRGTVAAPPGGLGRYKYLVRRGDTPPAWEAGADRPAARNPEPDTWRDH